jgi:hypothetical protein
MTATDVIHIGFDVEWSFDQTTNESGRICVVQIAIKEPLHEIYVFNEF